MNQPHDVSRLPDPTGSPIRVTGATDDDSLLATTDREEAITREATDSPGGLPADTNPLDRTYRVAVVTLTTGFRIGGALLIGGLALAALRDQSLHDRADPLPDVVRAIGRGEGAAVVDLAIMTLIATPVAAALAIAASFARAGDRTYAILSLAVLLILGTSIGLALVR